jgi:hypothetical protein
MEESRMEIEAIHERAVELLVSGKRQYVVAKELGIGVRTLRRWASDEKFTAELRSQRECANKLAAEQLAEEALVERQLAKEGARKICELINDPKTPDKIRVQCLRISQIVVTQRARRAEAQEWREFVYFDKIARAEEKEAAEKKQLAQQQAEYAADLAKYKRECQAKSDAFRAHLADQEPPAPTPAPAQPIRHIKIDPAAVADKVLAELAAKMKVPEIRPKAAKTGHSAPAPIATQPSPPLKLDSAGVA